MHQLQHGTYELVVLRDAFIQKGLFIKEVWKITVPYLLYCLHGLVHVRARKFNATAVMNVLKGKNSNRIDCALKRCIVPVFEYTVDGNSFTPNPHIFSHGILRPFQTQTFNHFLVD